MTQLSDYLAQIKNWPGTVWYPLKNTSLAWCAADVGQQNNQRTCGQISSDSLCM